LAVQVRTAKAGHFGKVIKAIDDMITTLNEEGASDIAKRDQCLDEYQKNTKSVNKLDWMIKNNEAKIEKLNKLIELRTQDKADTNQKIKETLAYLADLADERKEEHAAFQKAKKDDQDAIALLEKAKAAMASYYKKNDVKMGEIQGSATGLLQEEPVFERSADDAPDATFTKKGSNKGASKGVLSLFTYIIEDLNDEISNGKAAEATSQTEYEEEEATAEKLLKELRAKVVTLDGIIAKRNDAKKEQNTDKKANNGDRDSEISYKAKIKPDCEWIMGAFDKRADARAAEMGGLTTAKEFLAGQAALLEQSKTPTLANIRFLGMN